MRPNISTFVQNQLNWNKEFDTSTDQKRLEMFKKAKLMNEKEKEQHKVLLKELKSELEYYTTYVYEASLLYNKLRKHPKLKEY